MSAIKFFCLILAVLLQTACGSGQNDRDNRYQAEQAAARAAESERRAAALVEKNRIAEQERQRREEEWERTRVQREAQQREEILREAQRRAEQDRADRERREQEERQAVEDKKSAVMPDSKCCALCIGPHAKLAPVPATMKAA